MPKVTRDEEVTRLKRFLIDVALDGALNDLSNGAAVYRNHSRRAIKDVYGSGCAALFEIIFCQWVRGGRNLQGQPFKSMWKLDTAVVRDLRDALAELRTTDNFTALEVLRFLKARGHEVKIRAKVYDGEETETVDFRKYTAIIVNKEQAKEIRRLKAEIRAAAKERKQQREAVQF